MADSGFGTTITWESGFLGEVISVDWSGIARESIDTTHMTTANNAKTFMPSDIYDPGEVSVEMAFNPSATPPITDAADEVTVTFPAGDTWVASGFLTSFDLNSPLEDRMTATAVVKLSGQIVVTPA